MIYVNDQMIVQFKNETWSCELLTHLIIKIVRIKE